MSVIVHFAVKGSNEQFTVGGLSSEDEALNLYGPYGNGPVPPVRLTDNSLLNLSRDQVAWARVETEQEDVKPVG